MTNTPFFAPSPRGMGLYVADTEKESYALMKRKKKDFDYMTSSVLMEHQKHLLASLHFKCIYDRLLFFPSIAITLISGILAVLAQSNSDQKAQYTVSIAILASVSIFWQSLMKQLDYGGRASLHDSAANSLTKILKLATLRSREQQINDLDDTLDDRKKKKAELPDGLDHVDKAADVTNQKDNDTGSNAPHQDQEVHVVDGEDHFVLSKQFEQALQGCTSVVPIQITAAFDALDSRINVCNKRMVPTSNTTPIKVAWEKVYPALYYQLT